ncbi:unnamed protein product [Closterium sp. NIES-53]
MREIVFELHQLLHRPLAYVTRQSVPARTRQEEVAQWVEDAVEKDSTRTPVADGTVHPLTSYVINYVKFLFECKDSTRTPVTDGTVHPLTSYVINYVKFLLDYEGTLRQLFEEAEKERGEKDWQCGDSFARQKPRLEVATLRILTVLESNLEGGACMKGRARRGVCMKLHRKKLSHLSRPLSPLPFFSFHHVFPRPSSPPLLYPHPPVMKAR